MSGIYISVLYYVSTIYTHIVYVLEKHMSYVLVPYAELIYLRAFTITYMILTQRTFKKLELTSYTTTPSIPF